MQQCMSIEKDIALNRFVFWGKIHVSPPINTQFIF